MSTFSGYTFSSKSAEVVGNVALHHVENAPHQLALDAPKLTMQSDQYIAVFTDPSEAFKFMPADAKMYKCDCEFPVKVSSLFYLDLARCEPTRGRSNLNKHVNTNVLFVNTVTSIETISVEDYINTPAFIDWMLRNNVINSDYLRICWASFTKVQRNYFVRRFPFDFVVNVLETLTNDELITMCGEYSQRKAFEIWLRDNTLAKTSYGEFDKVLAELLPHKVVTTHNDPEVRRIAQIALIKLNPFQYVYADDAEYRSVALKAIYSEHGGNGICRIDFSKETNKDNKLFIINHSACNIDCFIKDPDYEVRYAARSRRNNTFDKIWLYFNKE